MNSRVLLAVYIACFLTGTLAAQPAAPMGGGGAGSAGPGRPGPGATGGAGASGAGGFGTTVSGQAGGSGAAGGPMFPGPGGGGGMPGGSSMSAEKDIKAMSLEELLAKALRDNPDLRVAETKVHEAEAELIRTKLQVVERVTKLQRELAWAQEMAAAAQDLFEMARKTSGASSARESIEARITFAKTKLDLIKLETELAYLVGKQAAPKSTSIPMGGMLFPPGMGGGTGSSAGPVPFSIGMDYGVVKKLPVSLTDKIRKALDAEITLRQSEMSLHEAVSLLADKMEGVNVHIADKKLTDTKINLYLLRSVPLGAVFQYFEDELNCKCVVREYGIVIAPRDRTPPGAQTLFEVWKERTKSDASKAK